jgi:ribosomal protein L24E
VTNNQNPKRIKLEKTQKTQKLFIKTDQNPEKLKNTKNFEEHSK